MDNLPLLLKFTAEAGLLLLWMFVSYYPPKAGDVKELTDFIKVLLVGLAGHISGVIT